MPSAQVWINGGIATMRADAGPYGAIHDGVVGATNGRIDWVGFRKAMPPTLIGPATQVHELNGGWLTPGLIDCHTHLVFAGERSAEFESRLGGVSYEATARAGGGILSTVAATRAATQAELVALAKPRVQRLMADGVTTVEIKSGYGLTLEDELKMLRAARQLGVDCGIRVRTTLLAAHTVPPEFDGNADVYVDHIVHIIIPAAAEAGLADAVDGFAEAVAFSREQISRVFAAARDYDLPVKLHADQLTDGRGAALAARFGALSADHLEYTSETGVREMADAGTVAVLLPGAYATVGATQPPPVALFRKHEVDMAVATDLNPGSSPLNSLLMAMNLACCLFRLTPEEALAGTTRNAAKALGIDSETGTLDEGKAADVAVWAVKHPRELSYLDGRIEARVSMFFFCKKEPKNLRYRPHRIAGFASSVRGTMRKSLLLLFFRKEGLPFTSPSEKHRFPWHNSAAATPRYGKYPNTRETALRHRAPLASYARHPYPNSRAYKTADACRPA